jgi:hypothetical protein
MQKEFFVMRKLLVPAATMVIAMLGASCDSAGSGGIYPLTVGNKWTHDSYVLHGPTQSALDTLQTSSIVVDILKKDALNSGPSAFQVFSTSTIHWFSPDTNYVITGYSYMREDDGAVLSYESRSDTNPDTLAFEEMTVGKTWHDHRGLLVEVVGQEDVTVKAGTYTGAFKVKYLDVYDSDTFPVYRWYAMDVGEVQTDYEFTPDVGFTQVFHSELASAAIK